MNILVTFSLFFSLPIIYLNVVLSILKIIGKEKYSTYSPK